MSGWTVLTGYANSLALGVTGNGNDLFPNFTSVVALYNLMGRNNLRVNGEASIDGLIATTCSLANTANQMVSVATIL